MVEIIFGEETVEYMLDAFDLEEDEDGLVVDSNSGKHIEDAFGNRIKSSEVGSIIHLDSYDMTVRSDGRILGADNETVTSDFRQKQSIVPVDEDTGITRDSIGSLIDYTEAQRAHENTTTAED